MQERARCSVLVTGAGSSGLATALELRRQGVDTVVIDAAKQACTESRGTGLQPRTLELLDLYGIADTLVAKGNCIEAFVNFRHGQEIGRIDFTLASSRYNFSPALPQSQTEGVLRAKLEELGAKVRWNHRLSGLVQTGDGVAATVQTQDGPIVIHADWAVGADGARSTVRTLIGLEFEGRSYPEAWGLLDAELEWDLPPNQVRVFRLDGADQFVLVPLGGSSYRVQVNHRPEGLEREPPTLDEMQAAFDRFTGRTGRLSRPGWASAFSLHRRQVATYRSSRAFLVGDAAHIHTPAGAQGLNTGIQDGFNLGWKLGLVCRGKAQADLLDSYEAERKPIAAAVLELAEGMARNAPPPASAAVPPQLMANRVTQLLVNYRNGPLGQPPREGQLVAGDRVPDIMMGEESLYHRLRGGGISVALVGDKAACADAEALIRSIYADVRIFAVAADSKLATALGLTTGAIAIRPDAYLGLSVGGNPLDAAKAVAAWLGSTLHLLPKQR